MKWLFPPNRWQVGLVALLGAGLLAFAHSWPVAGWAYADVAAVSAEFRQSLLTVGIFASAVAAWVGSVASPPTMAFAPAGSARRGGPLAWSGVTFLAITSAAGLTLGLAPAALWAAGQSTSGTFDLVAIASGYACLLAYLSFGYLIGCLLPVYLAAPMALVFAYALVFFSPTVLSPVFDFDIISGLEVPARVSLLRIVFFAGCAVAATLASAAWLRLRTPTNAKGAVTCVAVLLLPLAAVGYGSSAYATPLVVSDMATPVCDRRPGLTVCVHPSRLRLLAPLTNALSAVRAVGGPDVFPNVEVYDATLTAPPPASERVELHIQGQSDNWLASATADVVGDVTGVTACYDLSSSDTTSLDVSSAVGAWLLEEAGQDAASLLQSPDSRSQFETLLLLGETRARQQIAGNIDQIRQCLGGPIT